MLATEHSPQIFKNAEVQLSLSRARLIHFTHYNPIASMSLFNSILQLRILVLQMFFVYLRLFPLNMCAFLFSLLRVVTWITLLVLLHFRKVIISDVYKSRKFLITQFYPCLTFSYSLISSKSNNIYS